VTGLVSWLGKRSTYPEMIFISRCRARAIDPSAKGSGLRERDTTAFFQNRVLLCYTSMLNIKSLGLTEDPETGISGSTSDGSTPTAPHTTAWNSVRFELIKTWVGPMLLNRWFDSASMGINLVAGAS